MSSVVEHNKFVSLSVLDIDLEEHHRKLRRQEISDEIAVLDQKAAESMLSKPCPKCTSKMHRHGKTKGKEVWTLVGLSETLCVSASSAMIGKHLLFLKGQKICVTHTSTMMM